MKKLIFVFFIAVVFIQGISAQSDSTKGFQTKIPHYNILYVGTYAELRNDMMSEGLKENVAIRSDYFCSSFYISGGARFSANLFQGNFVNAVSVNAGKVIDLFRIPITVSGFYLWSPISQDLREYNAGLFFSTRFGNFIPTIGLNTRIYAFSKAAIAKYGFTNNTSTYIWEPINVMYDLAYNQRINSKLNLRIRVTNFDPFVIQQETNPMLSTQLSYALSNKLVINSELVYLQAGLLNMRVNYFGYYFRGGLTWNFRIKEK